MGKISCVRGPLSKCKIVVSDRQGNQFYCAIDKILFDSVQPEKDLPIEVLDELGNKKKIMRSYLTFEKLL